MLSKREITAMRRDLQKSLNAELKAQGRPRGWKSAKGIVFTERNGWFVQIWPQVWLAEPRTEAKVLAKPMAVDPVLWSMMGEPQLTREPLSYRCFGVLAAAPIVLAHLFLTEGDAASLAAQAIDLAEQCARRISDDPITIADFADRLEKDGLGMNSEGTRVAALVAAGDERKARSAIAELDCGKLTDGAIGPRGGFAESAGAWFAERDRAVN